MSQAKVEIKESKTNRTFCILIGGILYRLAGNASRKTTTTVEINSQELRDINRKLEVINNLKDLKVGYFFLLENLYFDMKDLFDDLMLYKVTTTEYKEEIENIILLFNEDLLYEGIDFEYILEESC